MDAAQFEKTLASVLSWWDEAGVETPPLAPAQKKRSGAHKRGPVKRDPLPSAKASAARSGPAAQAPPPEDGYAKSAADMAAKSKTLEDLKAGVEAFNAGPLSDAARGAVFSRGHPSAKIMIIGEAPGAPEDAAGKPFIGPSGQLLDRIFASIGLTEDSLYITNVVNWRPPNNRKPTENEIALCLPIIKRHIALAKPRLIVLVGGVSMTALTGLKGITKTRGNWERLEVDGTDVPALITYHPAYLLRQPHLKRDVWRDMLSLKAKMAEL